MNHYAKIYNITVEAINKGIQTQRGEGLRTEIKQWADFQKGRIIKNGIWVPLDPVHHTGIVTWATPDKAPHCPHRDYDGAVGSCALDMQTVVNGKIAWNEGDPGYDRYPELGQLAEDKAGLAWGGRWGKIADLDHFELPDWRALQ